MVEKTTITIGEEFTPEQVQQRIDRLKAKKERHQKRGEGMSKEIKKLEDLLNL